jgi:hypothetical protein
MGLMFHKKYKGVYCMKNWKQSVFFGMVAIITLGFGIVGCDNDNGKTGTDEFTVTFDLDGGNIDGVTSNVEITVKSGEKIANLPVPQKADNTLGGWFTEKNGNGDEFVSTIEVTSNLTVFAKWIPDPECECPALTLHFIGDTLVCKSENGCSCEHINFPGTRSSNGIPITDRAGIGNISGVVTNINTVIGQLAGFGYSADTFKKNVKEITIITGNVGTYNFNSKIISVGVDAQVIFLEGLFADYLDEPGIVE